MTHVRSVNLRPYSYGWAAVSGHLRCADKSNGAVAYRDQAQALQAVASAETNAKVRVAPVLIVELDAPQEALDEVAAFLMSGTAMERHRAYEESRGDGRPE